MSIDVRDRLIDAHIHAWTDDFEKYPLMPGFTREDLWQPHFTPADHQAYSSQFGRVRINLVQMTWYGLDHSYILDLIAAEPDRFVGTGMVPGVCDISLSSPGKNMVALAQRGIYAFRVRGGICRQAFGDVSRWLDYPTYEEMFEVGAEHNLALSFLMANQELPDLERMCSRFPDTPVILDHVCGCRIKEEVFPEEQIQNLCAMARHRRVMVKMGPLHALGDGKAPYLDLLPLIERIVDAFGPERCMWESDSGGPMWMKEPQTDFPAAVALINEHADFLSDGDREYILYRTAEEFFFNR